MVRSVIARLLEIFSGGSGLFQPMCNFEQRVPRSAIVLSPGEIPTTELYLKRRLEKQFDEQVYHVNTLNTSPDEVNLGNAPLTVVVRYAPLNWLRWLKQQKDKIAGTVFLMDDDMPSAFRAPELPFRYALKTTWRYARSRRLLSRVCSEVWLSTPELMQRYAGASPRLLEPEYVAPSSSNEEPVVYFYHGSWAHRREIKWLVPIIRQVQESVPNAWFEILGTDRVNRMFRGIPRVRVVHPMPWKDYLDYAGTVRYQIGLAPCFDTEFNRARSHSKVFDITRLGAAGIYSDVTPYAEKIIDGQTGLLCENAANKWVEALILLLNDEALRTSLHLKAGEWCGDKES